VTQYRLSSTPMFYVPGLILWILALRRGNVKGARTDKAARVHFLKASWPTLPDTAVEAILRGDYRVDGEDVIVEA
jgi:hypothetical protein